MFTIQPTNNYAVIGDFQLVFNILTEKFKFNHKKEIQTILKSKIKLI